jgi:DNA-binding LacI/PurR family transcriptional regulator
LKIDRISLGNTQTFKYVRPKVTSFNFPLETLVKQVRELILYRLDHPDAPVREEKTAPEFVPGDTF